MERSENIYNSNKRWKVSLLVWVLFCLFPSLLKKSCIYELNLRNNIRNLSIIPINRIEVVIQNYRILHKNLVGTKKRSYLCKAKWEIHFEGDIWREPFSPPIWRGGGKLKYANRAIVKTIALFFIIHLSTCFQSMQHFRRKQIQKAQNKSFPLCLASFTSFVRVLLAHFFMDESFSV